MNKIILIKYKSTYLLIIIFCLTFKVNKLVKGFLSYDFGTQLISSLPSWVFDDADGPVPFRPLPPVARFNKSLPNLTPKKKKKKKKAKA